MSLRGFQLALADLAASLRFCARVADDPDAALAGYELTPVERRRIVSAARQKGMRVNCALYRYNRIVTLSAVLPGTLHLLGDAARGVVDAFWAGRAPDRNMRREAALFADFVRGELDAGRLASPYLREVVDFEMARYEVATAPLPAQAADGADLTPGYALAPHPRVRVAAFAHDPQALLAHLAHRRPPPYADVAAGEFYLLLDCREGGYRQRPLDPGAARILLAARAGSVDEGFAADLEPLLAEGLLVRTASAGGERHLAGV